MNPPPKLLDQVRDKIRYKHYSIRTEQAYTDWIKRFIMFNDMRHPKDMGEEEVEQFLSHLAVEKARWWHPRRIRRSVPHPTLAFF